LKQLLLVMIIHILEQLIINHPMKQTINAYTSNINLIMQ